MKEPGQMWAEVFGMPWAALDEEERATCAANEAAIRADEAARVRAEAIEAIKSCGSLDENGYICTKSDAIKAIRALGEKPKTQKGPASR
jgi:hypothetical protein